MKKKSKKEILLKLKTHGFENFQYQNRYGLNALMI